METREVSQIKQQAWYPPSSRCSINAGGGGGAEVSPSPTVLGPAWWFSASLTAECHWPRSWQLLGPPPSLGNSIPQPRAPGGWDLAIYLPGGSLALKRSAVVTGSIW